MPQNYVKASKFKNNCVRRGIRPSTHALPASENNLILPQII